MNYQVWVHDEDRINEAQKALELFIQRPSNAAFDTPITEQLATPHEAPPIEERAIAARVRTPFTTLILFLCSMLFMLNVLEEYSMQREGVSAETFAITPVQALFLFDLPPVIAQLETLIEEHQLAPDQKIDELPSDIQHKLSQLEKTSFWQGTYQWVLLKLQGKDPSKAEGPLFERIRQGEIWRLISPAFLHRDFLHILFNMIWVWVLCRPIEQRIGIIRLALLSLICGVISNVAQYLMSGPFFIGYSGIVMGLAGFTWVREKTAPWEGYPLHRTTILFLLLFIGGMFALQAVSFLLQIFTSLTFEPNIANPAHIVGDVKIWRRN